jgi:anti-sigma factor RsiW
MTHPDEGALLRYLDGQLLASEIENVQEHLSTCITCAARNEEIRRTLSRVTVALREMDTDPRRSRTRDIRWLAAAAAVVLLALASSVAPVRAWILNRTQALWEAVVASEGATTTIPDTAHVVEPTTASVSFVPTTDVFILEVTARQVVGSLTVEIGDNDTATATIAGNGQNEELVVLPNGLRIVNAPGSVATYVVQSGWTMIPARSPS